MQNRQIRLPPFAPRGPCVKAASSPSVPSPSGRSFPTWGFALIAILVVVIALTILVIPPALNSDGSSEFKFVERVAPAFTSPYRNTKPGVAYVGDTACAGCHAKTCETYHAHPMGRSMGAVADKAGGPFVWNGVRYSVERKGEAWVHREEAVDGAGRVVARTEVPVRHAIGSGTHAVSYLIDRDGVVSQSPVTWYAATNAFGLSPGFETVPDKFERAVLPGCVFCHVNAAQGVPHSLNAFKPVPNLGTAIGCERCHGPGEAHVALRKETPYFNGLDETIVNPVDLPPALREDVCNQCHLGGKERVIRRGKGAFDYRPGLPLDEFIRVFVLPTTATTNTRIAGHVEQMNASRCFVASKGEMGCASCHDPHVAPSAEKTVSYFRTRCLDCHKEKGCSEPEPQRLAVSKADDCAACHMPKAKTMISHVALTDHRVPRRPTEGVAPASPGEAEVLAAIRSLVPFGKGGVDINDAELTRDLAVGLTARARTLPDAVRREVAQAHLPALERAVKNDPDDLPAREGLVMALAWLDLTGPALAACDEGLANATGAGTPLIRRGRARAKTGLSRTQPRLLAKGAGREPAFVAVPVRSGERPGRLRRLARGGAGGGKGAGGEWRPRFEPAAFDAISLAKRGERPGPGGVGGDSGDEAGERGGVAATVRTDVPVRSRTGEVRPR